MLPGRSLQRITAGGILTGLSFIVAGLVELQLEVIFSLFKIF